MSEQLREAARSLLAGGYVTGQAASSARRSRRELAQVFRDEFGWQVTVDDHAPVRALCQPGAAHMPRGLRARAGRHFDSRRYALLFLVLASLEAAGARTTLTVLFDEVASRAEEVDELDFDRNDAASRRAFVHAVQAAVDIGILELADGTEEMFASSGEGDALYRVDRPRVTHLLATSKPPSLAADAVAAVAENLYTDTEEGRVRHRRHRVTRALVCEPVVYRDDLTEAEVAYLVGQEGRLRRVLRDTFGLTLEVRAEGWVAVDVDGDLTDQKFPAISIPRAAALAIVDASRTKRSDDGTCRWTTPDLHSYVATLGTRFGSSWSVDPDDADAVARVTADAIGALLDMRLAVTDADDLVVLPAAGRFALTDDDTQPPAAMELA